ncbi:hypothetical protein [uncultured Sunxiuqinia sp.]|uniref:hypothetical protein n=1 Tax=uncultured Sunxiuqinia sp. TaxID=1573825 RepID=UPI00261AFC14|nr:hypothetical protein [uncultured Sunxiuqinia sp.]
MERRDYLIHQIQEMGAFLARLILRLQKKEVQPSAEIASVAYELENELGFKLNDLLFLDNAAFIELVQEKLLADENMEQFAVLLEQLGDVALENETFLRQQIYYRKAMELLVFVDRNSQSYSMQRQQRIVTIRTKLNA